MLKNGSGGPFCSRSRAWNDKCFNIYDKCSQSWHSFANVFFVKFRCKTIISGHSAKKHVPLGENNTDMRLKIWFPGLLFFVCGSLFSQLTIIDSIESGGIQRNYRLYVPTAYDDSQPVPIVLNLHGYSSDALGQDLYANFRLIADTANFLIVIPNGTFDAYGIRYWNCWNAPGTGVDDVAFLSDLIDSISLQYNVDANRIYSTGMSNGGFMSHALACELSNKIAAIASVTGSIDKDRLPYCAPEHAMPVMQIHGTEDPTVPYLGNLEFLPIDSIVHYWANINACDEAAEFTEIPDIITTDGCTAEHYVYDGCNQTANVELFKIIGGEHTWPGTAITFLGVTNLDINACKEIWNFFRRYRLDELTAITPGTEPVKNNIVLHPNPANEYITVGTGNYEIINTLILYDIQGRKLMTKENLKSNTYNIALTNYAAGSYLIQIITESSDSVLTFIRE